MGRLMNHLILFENYKSNPTSMDSRELVNKLRPLFEPSYNLEGPLGEFSEEIEMTFNENISLEDIKNIISGSNWFVAKTKRNGDSIYGAMIRPIYSKVIKKRLPKYIYHVSPSSNDESITQKGLISSNDLKLGLTYPNRIFVVSKLKMLGVLTKELNWHVGKNKWSVWKIDTTNLDIDFLYVDTTVNQPMSKPYAFYLQEVDLPSDKFTLHKHIIL